MTLWCTFLNHCPRKASPSNITWLSCLRSDRAFQLYWRHEKTKYTHMTCYVLNWTSPRERNFFSLTHFLLWFMSKYCLIFELNSETKGRLQQSVYLTLSERRARIKYQRWRVLHLGLLMQSIVSPSFCMHHPLWVSKLEVTFVLIIVHPKDKLFRTITLDGDTPCLLTGVNVRMIRLISPLLFLVCFQRSYKGLLF